LPSSPRLSASVSGTPRSFRLPSFPAEAFKEIQANKEEYISELIESLDYVYQNAEKLYEEKSDYFLHTYAMFLLAEFREKKAFAYLVAFLRLPEKYVNFVVGESLTEDYHLILTSTFDGENLQMLLDVIENQELFEWAREIALRAYMLLHLEGYVVKDEFISYLRSLIYDKLSDEKSDVVNTSIVSCIIDARMVQMIPDARFLHEHDKVDPGMHGDYDSFLDCMFYDKLHEYKTQKERYINDAFAEMRSWGCFKDNDEDKPKKSDTDKFDALGEFITEGIKKDKEQEQAIIENAQKKKKPGRNEPCHCGSGKKYKKCCLDSDNSTDVVFNSPSARIEDKYDLLEMYPKDSQAFKELYEEEARNIDMLVYKALHHRAIPMWVKRDREQERLGKIDYLNEALELFLDKCGREQITSFDAYDEKYMVHYWSSGWVAALFDLTKDDDLPRIANIRKKAIDTFYKFKNNNISEVAMKDFEKNAEREERIDYEIVVDAYDAYERAAGWYCYLENQLTFPFKAKVIRKSGISPLKEGEEVSVLGMADQDECEDNMFVQIEWDGRKFGVPLEQLEPVNVDEDTAEAVEDWHYWVNRGYCF